MESLFMRFLRGINILYRVPHNLEKILEKIGGKIGTIWNKLEPFVAAAGRPKSSRC